MDLAYLLGGESLTAAGMNALFEEADRRTALCLDDHSILYLLQTDRATARSFFSPYFGPAIFIWCAGPQPISGYWGTWSYDHSVFQNAAAAALQYSGAKYSVADTDHKFIRINPLPSAYWTQIGQIKSAQNQRLFQFSLEAHRRSYTPPGGTPQDFWIAETWNPNSDTAALDALPAGLERRRNYDQAELVFEGTAFPAFDFPAAWNKFDFFRIHNLNGAPLQVNFKDSDGSVGHVVNVAPYCSRCVRRTGVDGDYTTGFKYFQKFLAGDPRWYQHGTSNNVTNPSLLIPFINHVLGGVPVYPNDGPNGIQFASPTVMLDPHVLAPLPDGYDTRFADPSAGDSLLGDCLHHAGEFRDARTKPGDVNTVTSTALTFNGYGQLVNIPGLAVREVGDDLQIKSAEAGVTHDFLGVSTNFFCTGDGSFITTPVIDGTNWKTLDRHMPAGFSTGLEVLSTTSGATYNLITGVGGLGAPVTQTITKNEMLFSERYPTATLLPHRTTSAEVKARAAGPHCSFTSTTLELTSAGLVLKTTQTIPLDQPFAPGSLTPSGNSDDYKLNNLLTGPVVPVISALQRLHVTLAGGAVVIKRAMIFTGYGFPDTNTWQRTGFFTPRTTRTFSDRPVTLVGERVYSRAHPDFSEGYLNTDGREIIYRQDIAGFRESPISLLAPWNSASDQALRDATDVGRNQIVGTLSNNDVLPGALKYHAVAGYWNAATGAGVPYETNRKRCHANRIFYAQNAAASQVDGAGYTHDFMGGFDAGDMFRFWRMEMAVEHFNNLAAKVNSMSRYQPLNFLDHGVIQNGSDQNQRYRLTPNRRGIFEEFLESPAGHTLSGTAYTDYLARIAQWRGTRPKNQFASFAAGAATELIAGWAGIPVRGIADLPDNFNTQKNATRKTVQLDLNYTLTATDTATVAYNGTNYIATHVVTLVVTGGGMNPIYAEQAGSVRFDLASITQYRWLSAADVRACAESRGYKFIFVQMGIELSLQLFEPTFTAYPPSGLSYTETENLGPSPGHPPPSNYSGTLVSHFAGGRPGLTDQNPLGTTHQARYLEFVQAAGNWIAGDDTARFQVQAMTQADQKYQTWKTASGQSFLHGIRFLENTRGTTRVLGPFFARFEIPENLRRVSYPNGAADANYLNSDSRIILARNPADYTTDFICRAVTVASYSSAGIPVPTTAQPALAGHFLFTEDFSETSPAARLAAINYNRAVYPFTAAAVGAVRPLLWADFSSPM